jgi:hypothetical protein
MKHIIRKIEFWLNSGINSYRKRKVFCIGLHKTGTTSLYDLAKQYGFNAVHSTSWQNSQEKLTKFNFFCDGGSHFDAQNEFDFERLLTEFPNALFILQTRDTQKWVVSKLKHAGWKEDTVIQPNDPTRIQHDDWEYKSLLTIESFIKHKYQYEKKVIDFFREHAPNQLLVVDITNRETQEQELSHLLKYLGTIIWFKPSLPHRNKAKTKSTLSPNVIGFINKIVSQYEADILT